MKFVDRTVEVVNKINSKASGKKLKDFKDTLKEELVDNADIQRIKKDIDAFSQKFPVPGGLL